jgi:hypothetical protein
MTDDFFYRTAVMSKQKKNPQKIISSVSFWINEKVGASQFSEWSVIPEGRENSRQETQNKSVESMPIIWKTRVIVTRVLRINVAGTVATVT